ncbi:murein biosynthesis integral membrane protein MurJ [Nocardioides piscis]|nr:murein biosynthesis integral membrane protein MurJ [Nocardioides piscis]EON24551.1 integral membrane protein MviN [Nocardioides sp. CF8]
MAAGTLFSRISGFVRAFLLAAALGNLLSGDLFSIANTIPNMLYILLAGGIFNAVLVPQLVRATKTDADGGEAFTNRVITLAALFLGTITLLLVVAAPWVMGVFLDPVFDDPQLATQRASVVDFARYCLPQVFFYGMFVLVGQILNAHGRFGPMMWAPIANNAVSVLVLAAYLLVYGPARGDERCQGFEPGQELLLGLGSTLGIVVQCLILLPYLRRAGIRYRPQFDFRDSGLGHTLRLGTWTILVVAVNQIAYTVVVRLASGGTAQSATDGCGVGMTAEGTGYTVYSTAFLIVMVPHSIVTVSIATAVLPRLSRLAADRNLPDLAISVAGTLRASLTLIVPFAFLIPVIAADVANAISFGAARSTSENYGPTIALFGPGILFFTVHYLMLRGFFALERTQTVFWVQCIIAGVNVAAAMALVGVTEARLTAPSLAAAYGASYAVGSALSYLILRRALGGLDTRRLLAFLARMLVPTVGATGMAYLLAHVLHATVEEPTQLTAALWVAAVATADGIVFLGLAWLLRVAEITQVGTFVVRRLHAAARHG